MLAMLFATVNFADAGQASGSMAAREADRPLCPLNAARPTAGPVGEKIQEEKFVAIGGIEQWVTINGTSCSNPVILFLHGGPGNPMSPYADALYGAWARDFTLVQWDQRGAGRTYGRNAGLARQPPRGLAVPEVQVGQQLTMEGMAQDGIELASYLARHLNTRKVILFGGSWGSALGVHMAKARPDLFHAYVGTGQMVSYRENEAGSYRKLVELAGAAGDTKTLAAMEALGPPPWVNPRNFGILRRATRVYEAKTSTPAPRSWWMPAPQYATQTMQADHEAGEEFSFLQFVGLKGNGIFSGIDLPKLGLRFDIPVYLLQGAEDLVTTPDVAKRYFDSIVAPQKEFVLLPRTGHDPNEVMIEAQYSILKTRVAPLLR